MIHQIDSSLSTFKTLTFRPGLNILLADKSQGATDRQTRNSSGKSSLIEIIHFVLGSDCNPDSIFRSERLANEDFVVSFDLNHGKSVASRKGSAANRIVIDGDHNAWSIKPKRDKATGEEFLTKLEWRAVLGEQMFGIETNDEAHAPSLRSLFSYFARRENSGGFQSANQHATQQANWDVQINLSYLLGLDWKISRSLELLRKKEKSLETMRKEMKDGLLGQLLGTSGELRTRLTVLETKVKKLSDELRAFRVLPEYEQLEQEASSIAIEISSLTNLNALDLERVDSLKAQFEEPSPQLADIGKIYQEAQLVLPELVTQRLVDVQNFHLAVMQNRRSHLQAEIDAANRRITSQTERKDQLDNRRREILTILDSHGAIDQMVQLQSELSRLQANAEDLKKRLDFARQIEGTKTELTIERATIRQQLSNDIEDRVTVLTEAIVAFEEFSERISDHEGSLTINVTDNGPEFAIQVEGGRSKGIKNMQIFCFDMMLAVLWSARDSGPGFLIHDSHLFDGMDSRQIAKAIEIGAEQSRRHGFQYIVTLNSDVLKAAEFSPSFDPSRFVNPVRLSDLTETGGLFGVRI